MTAIPELVHELARTCGIAPDPCRRGPVPLNRYFRELTVLHVSLPRLTSGTAALHLVESRCVNGPEEVPTLWGGVEKLDGMIFCRNSVVTTFVNADNILARRRFTAAHELGHAVLHREVMGSVLEDATIEETDGPLSAMEAEANRFAAELLMPEVVLRARADELRAAHGCCPRVVLAGRLASELLVSRQAIDYRLKDLGVGDGE